MTTRLSDYLETMPPTATGSKIPTKEVGNTSAPAQSSTSGVSWKWFGIGFSLGAAVAVFSMAMCMLVFRPRRFCQYDSTSNHGTHDFELKNKLFNDKEAADNYGDE